MEISKEKTSARFQGLMSKKSGFICGTMVPHKRMILGRVAYLLCLKDLFR